MLHEEAKERIDLHHKVLFGDPNRMDEMPGIIAQHRRTNEILTEVRDSLSRINWLIIAGFVTAIGSTIYKSLHQ